MSKIVLVVNSDVPFVHGGHRVIATELVRAIERCGHRAELVRTPSNRFGRTLEAYLANWLTDVGQTGYGETVDHVISLRYPAYAVRHPQHTAWVIHRMREYYDLWEHFAPTLSRRGRIKEELRRRIIHRIDRQLLGEGVRQVYCISDTVRERLRRWGDIPARTLHPPPAVRAWRTTAYEPFVLAVSRLHRWKRLDLLVEAVAQRPGLRAIIVGTGPEADSLQAQARARGADSRIEFTGAVDDEKLLDLYARAGCVYFGPLHEDYGFVTVEAFMARKPVVSCTDSGGASELLVDGSSGYVVPPEAGPVGEALERLISDPQLAEKFGAIGHVAASALSWERTVRALLLEDE